MTGIRSILVIALFLPAIVAAEERCPWLNVATAGGVLGGEVHATVTPTSCEFVRRVDGFESELRIEVVAANGPHEQCGAGAEPITAIGNEAQACAWRGRAGWTAEQVTGRVRDRSFLVRIGTNNRTASAQDLRGKARNVAEQVAGILF